MGPRHIQIASDTIGILYGKLASKMKSEDAAQNLTRTTLNIGLFAKPRGEYFKVSLKTK